MCRPWAAISRARAIAFLNHGPGRKPQLVSVLPLIVVAASRARRATASAARPVGGKAHAVALLRFRSTGRLLGDG